MVRIKPNKSCLLLRQECKINIYIISMALDARNRHLSDSIVNDGRRRTVLCKISLETI